MDGDPAVEPELDSFSLFLPLPYRVAIILVLGIWAWALNLHYLALVKIDVAGLIKYSSRSSPAGPAHHSRVYRLAFLITIPLCLSLLLFWAVTRGSVTAVLSWDILPQLYLLFLVVAFVVPLQQLSRTGRYRFLHTLRRISIGGIAEAQDGKFGDILLADALTSYAKVLGDLFVTMCMFFGSNHSSTAKPDRTCGIFMVPLIISYPSIIRLRQCLIEYQRVRKSVNSAGGSASSGWGGQHLANALKYATAFPVTILSALQRDRDHYKLGMSEASLFRLWLFFVFVNSFYSFWWDVTKDWDLTMFAGERQRNDPDHAWGLRRYTFFHSKNIYYTAIIIDLLLRCTWSLKLSPHLDHFNDLEGSIFVMEVLEVFRRWVWIFLRVETEWSKALLLCAVQLILTLTVRNNRGPVTEDILLGNYRHVKDIDDDD